MRVQPKKKKHEPLHGDVKNPNANILTLILILAPTACLDLSHHARGRHRAHDRKRRKNQSERDVNAIDQVRIHQMNRHRVPNRARSGVAIVDIVVVNAVDRILIRRALARAAEVDPDRIRAVSHRTMDIRAIHRMAEAEAEAVAEALIPVMDQEEVGGEEVAVAIMEAEEPIVGREKSENNRQNRVCWAVLV